ncbi:MAG: FHA domain-containing protein [Thermoleophilia bacterium]
MAIVIEVVEGPDAGRQAPLDRSLVVGRDPAADLVLGDSRVSRRHVRIDPRPDGAMVEDLGSANGTLVGGRPAHGPIAVSAGADVQVGVTVLQLRTADEVAAEPSLARPVPPALRTPEAPPRYVPEGALDAAPGSAARSSTAGLERLLDVRVKARARAAPIAIAALAVLVVLIYLAAR